MIPTTNLYIPDTISELNTLLQAQITVVDCFANWCAPCKIISPLFEQISSENMHVQFIKLDVEKFPEFASLHSIRNVPTILIFNSGKIKARFIGFTSEQKLRDFITINV